MRLVNVCVPVSFLAVMAVVTLGPIGDALAQETGIEGEIAAMETRLQEARAANLSLIAPKIFADAKAKLEEAQQRFARGGKIEDIRAKLREASQKLDSALPLEAVGNLLLKDALEARGDALAAKAPDFAAKEWEVAKQSMYDAGREVERGNQNKAREKAAEAVANYRTAELQAIRADLLGSAQVGRDEALQAGADKKAPQTFQRAEAHLSRAEMVLQGDRYQRAEARSEAVQAGAAFRHATLIAGLVDRVGEKNRGELEKLVLSYEGSLAEVAGTLNMEPDFSQGRESVTTTLLSAVESLKSDRENLQADFQGRTEELNQAGVKIDSLQTALAILERTERSTAAAMEQERQRQRNLADVRALFTPEEAVVLVDGEELIIRLYGLSFPVGSSEIQPQNFQLLTKLQRALRIYAGAPVEIEGHTDAQGNDDLNEALSTQRAEAVRAYLVANTGDEEGRYLTVGFGETRPIASNETADGRAKNRRIDVRIAAGLGGGDGKVVKGY